MIDELKTPKYLNHLYSEYYNMRNTPAYNSPNNDIPKKKQLLKLDLVNDAHLIKQLKQPLFFKIVSRAVRANHRRGDVVKIHSQNTDHNFKILNITKKTLEDIPEITLLSSTGKDDEIESMVELNLQYRLLPLSDAYILALSKV